MSSFRYNFEQFKEKIETLKGTKAYQPLIIEALLRSYPRSLRKKIISDHIRNYYDDQDYYEQFNIWNKLVDNDKLLNNDDENFSLNVYQLTIDQTNHLQAICRKKIKEMEGVESKVFQSIEKTIPSTTKELITNTQNYNIDSRLRQENNTVTIEKNNFNSENNESYYLYQIWVNRKDSIKRDQLSQGIDLSPKDKYKLGFEEGKINRIIFYDVKGDYVRIWGTARIVTKQSNPRNVANMDVLDFEPIGETIGNEIAPRWLKEELILPSMFGNRKMTPIDEENYNTIITSTVPANQLFTVEEKIVVNENLSHISNDDPLELPTKEIIHKGILQLQQELLIDKKIIEEIIIHLASGRHILLAGPIGTGKTHLARRIPELFWSDLAHDDLGYKVKTYTATYDWNTGDVISSIVPRTEDGKPVYKIQYGCVAETIQQSWIDKNSQDGKYRGTWLVIDEFNRAEIDKAFGQLFTSIETRTLLIPDEHTSDIKEITIPRDYRIIGTLNTADKHYLFKLSDALKRRFAYIEVKSPDKSKKEQEIYYALLNALNELSPEEFFNIIRIDKSTKNIMTQNSNEKFLAAIRFAYEILSFVRIIKDVGTAILKSIYQTLLVGSKINGYDDSILDIALTANIVPQLERIQSTNIDLLLSFCFDDVHSFFKGIFNSQDDALRSKYSKEFIFYLEFLGEISLENVKEKFAKKTLDDKFWNEILQKWNNEKLNLTMSPHLPLLKSALTDLKKTYEFL